MTQDKNQTYYILRQEFISHQVISNGQISNIDSNKYSSTTSKGCVLEIDLEYQKELPELHNDYFLAPYKIEIKKEILSNYQLSITYFHNIPIGAVKKLAASFFDT